MSKAYVIAGHRPTRFKFKYKEDYSLSKKLKKKITEQLKYLYDEKGVRRVYVGGSLGVDIWVGEIVLRLKETSGYEEFELAVILPFPKHDQKWDERSQKRLEFLIQHSMEHLVIGKKDCRESYVKRNCYMIDHADILLAVYDNDRSLHDDPIQPVRYAEEKKKKIFLIHPDTAEVTIV